MIKYFDSGDAIAGERIAASFRKINQKGTINKGILGERCSWAKLRGNVFCVVEKCLEADFINRLQRPNMHLEKGDCLKAEQIISQFGKMRRSFVTTGSSTHQIQTAIFEDKAYCVVDLPFEPVREK